MSGLRARGRGDAWNGATPRAVRVEREGPLVHVRDMRSSRLGVLVVLALVVLALVVLALVVGVLWCSRRDARADLGVRRARRWNSDRGQRDSEPRGPV